MTYLPPRLPTFEAALRDADAGRPEARLRAAERLGDPPEGVEGRARRALLTLATDAVGPIRGAALESLGRVGGEGARDRIVEGLQDPDANVRQHAVTAAAALGEVPVLRSALVSELPEVRFQAAAGLAALCPREALDAVGPLLDDPDPEVRAAAAEALAETGDGGARQPLRRRLDDPEEGVRWAAARGLARLGDGTGLPLLRQALGDPLRVVDAAEALGELGAQSARDDLRTLARRWWAPPLARAAAGAALARLGDPLGERTLRRVVRAWGREGRDYATRQLAELGLAEG